MEAVTEKDIKSPSASRILLVEDDSVCARIYQTGLTGCGFEITHITDGKVALKCLYFNHFDVVALDLMLPGMDGLQILEKMRQFERHKDTPVIVMTSVDLASTRRMASEHGALKFLNKQKDSPAEIIASIKRIAQNNLRNPEDGLRMLPSETLKVRKTNQVIPDPPPAPSKPQPKPKPTFFGKLFGGK